MDNLQIPVFYAPNGRRWRITRSLVLAGSLLLATFFAVFFGSLYYSPGLPGFNIRERKILTQSANPLIQANSNDGQVPASSVNNNLAHPVTVGFYVNYDDTSYVSLKRNIDKLDWLAPEWVRLSDDSSSSLVLDFDQKALDLIHKEKPSMPILPLVQNYKDEVWNSDILAKAVATKESRQKLIDALTKMVADNNFSGVTIDLEEVPKIAGESFRVYERFIGGVSRARLEDRTSRAV